MTDKLQENRKGTTMNFFIVVAHPEPKSFNHAMVTESRRVLEAAGHKVKVSDLNAMQWQPVSDRRNFTTVGDAEYYKQQAEELFAVEHDGFDPAIEAEMQKLFWCDVLIFQFPLWWFGMPAIMKGWVERVFAMGRVYGHGKWYETGSCKGKQAMLSLTTGSPANLFGGGGVHPPMEAILLPIQHGIFKFNGFTVLEPNVVYQAAHLPEDERKLAVEKFGQRVVAIGKGR